MSEEGSGKERRRSRRYPAVELRARLRTRKSLFSEAWEDVSPSDFSRSGIAVESTAELPVGTHVTLNLALHMELGVIEVEKLNGVVRHRKLLGNQSRYGIEFDPDQRVKGAELDSQLARIEGLLERSHNLAQRIIEQSHRPD